MRLRIRLLITLALLIAAGCAVWYHANRERLARQWACYKVGAGETLEEVQADIAWFETGPDRDRKLRELVGKWGTGNRRFDLNLAQYVDSAKSSEALRKAFSREFAWRRELLPRWAGYWSWQTNMEPDREIASIVGYLDDLAAAKAPGSITWRQVLELQAVFQLTGSEKLAVRLDPENWLSRYRRWRQARPAKLPHVARPKTPFAEPGD